jgi:hypothetical protein
VQNYGLVERLQRRTAEEAVPWGVVALDDEGDLEEGRGDPITAVTLCDPNIPTRITPPTTTPRGFNHAPILLYRILFQNNTLSSASIIPGL